MKAQIGKTEMRSPMAGTSYFLTEEIQIDRESGGSIPHISAEIAALRLRRLESQQRAVAEDSRRTKH